jgi:hypothetical protein
MRLRYVICILASFLIIAVSTLQLLFDTLVKWPMMLSSAYPDIGIQLLTHALERTKVQIASKILIAIQDSSASQDNVLKPQSMEKHVETPWPAVLGMCAAKILAHKLEA